MASRRSNADSLARSCRQDLTFVIVQAAGFSALQPFLPRHTMLDTNIQNQLKGYFTRLVRPVRLISSLDSTPASGDMDALLKEVAAISPLISYERDDDSPARRPSFLVTPAEGGTGGIRFACVPLGHEFTSFILAILQAGGHPAKISESEAQTICSLPGPLAFEVFISLSCHNCPEVVQALNLMAILNPAVRVTIIDGALFQKEAADRRIMGVPAVFLNGEPFLSGRRELKEILEKLDRGSAERTLTSLSSKAPFDVLVVGSGPAGTTAAIYSARKGLRTAVVAERLGGQVNETAEIENFTSHLRTDGAALAGRFSEHLNAYDIDIITPHKAVTVTREDSFWTLTLSNGARLRAKALIAATGARWKTLGIPGEADYRGRGVCYCPHCDGPLFRDKRVAVAGGGNSGAEAAIDLAGIASHVTLLQRSPALKADVVLQNKLRSLPNVDIICNALPFELEGDGTRLTALTYEDRTTGIRNRLNVDGCFVQVGLTPNTEWLDGIVETNRFGEIITDQTGASSADGLFAAGDCTAVPYRQIVIALGEGAKASLAAFDWLIRQE